MMNDDTKANHDNANNVNIYNHKNNHNDAQKGYHKVDNKDYFFFSFSFNYFSPISWGTVHGYIIFFDLAGDLFYILSLHAVFQNVAKKRIIYLFVRKTKRSNFSTLVQSWPQRPT